MKPRRVHKKTVTRLDECDDSDLNANLDRLRYRPTNATNGPRRRGGLPGHQISFNPPPLRDVSIRSGELPSYEDTIRTGINSTAASLSRFARGLTLGPTNATIPEEPELLVSHIQPAELIQNSGLTRLSADDISIDLREASLQLRPQTSQASEKARMTRSEASSTSVFLGMDGAKANELRATRREISNQIGAAGTGHETLVNEQKTDPNFDERLEIDNDIDTIIERLIKYRDSTIEYLEQDESADFERRCGPLNSLIRRTREKIEAWKLLAGPTWGDEPTDQQVEERKKKVAALLAPNEMPPRAPLPSEEEEEEGEEEEGGEEGAKGGGEREEPTLGSRLRRRVREAGAAVAGMATSSPARSKAQSTYQLPPPKDRSTPKEVEKDSSKPPKQKASKGQKSNKKKKADGKVNEWMEGGEAEKEKDELGLVDEKMRKEMEEAQDLIAREDERRKELVEAVRREEEEKKREEERREAKKEEERKAQAERELKEKEEELEAAEEWQKKKKAAQEAAARKLVELRKELQAKREANDMSIRRVAQLKRDTTAAAAATTATATAATTTPTTTLHRQQQQQGESSFQEKVEKKLEEMKWEGEKAEAFTEKARTIFEALDEPTEETADTAVDLASKDCLQEDKGRESDGGWVRATKDNAKKHKSPLKGEEEKEGKKKRQRDVRPKTIYKVRRPSSSSEDDEVPLKRKSTDMVRKEALARSVAEKMRPEQQNRFSGGTSIDFLAHKKAFQLATTIDGLDDHAVLGEMRYWFTGTPWATIEGMTTKSDAKRALQEAWDELDADYGSKKIPAKERLAVLLETGAINPEDQEAHMLLSANLRTCYEHAKKGGTHRQFDEPEIIQQILAIKMPYYQDIFLEKMEARKEREEREMEEVEETKLHHLIMHIKKRARLLGEKSKWKPEEKAPTNNTNNNNAGKNYQNNNNGNKKYLGQTQPGKGKASMFLTSAGGKTEYESYGSALREGPQQQQLPIPEHGPCQHCRGDHKLLHCPSFWDDLDALERLHEFNRNRWCYNCTSPHHSSRSCPAPRAKCEKCGKSHLTILHRDMDPRSTRPPGIDLKKYIPIGKGPVAQNRGSSNNTNTSNDAENNNANSNNNIIGNSGVDTTATSSNPSSIPPVNATPGEVQS